jgi:hypothetical protein
MNILIRILKLALTNTLAMIVLISVIGGIGQASMFLINRRRKREQCHHSGTRKP